MKVKSQVTLGYMSFQVIGIYYPKDYNHSSQHRNPPNFILLFFDSHFNLSILGFNKRFSLKGIYFLNTFKYFVNIYLVLSCKTKTNHKQNKRRLQTLKNILLIFGQRDCWIVCRKLNNLKTLSDLTFLKVFYKKIKVEIILKAQVFFGLGLG